MRGVDQLAFNYGVIDGAGTMNFLPAAKVDASTTCSPPPPGLNNEPGCAWRSVKTIEARLLVNTVDEVFGLDDTSRSYRFNGNDYEPADGDALPSGIKAGSLPRREFIAYVSGRNHNF